MSLWDLFQILLWRYLDNCNIQYVSVHLQHVLVCSVLFYLCALFMIHRFVKDDRSVLLSASSLQIYKLITLKLLEVLRWKFRNVSQHINILCDSIFKDIGQLKRGPSLPPLKLNNLEKTFIYSSIYRKIEI